MKTADPIQVDYIRTSTADQSGDRQQDILEPHFPRPPDRTIRELNTSGTTQPKLRSHLIKQIKILRKSSPKAPILFRLTHVDRFLKATDVAATVSTYQWMKTQDFPT